MPAMRRAVPGRVVLIIVAATAGCQMTGSRPVDAPGDKLTVSRFYSAKFDPVKVAVEDIMHDHDFMKKIAGFDYSQGVATSSWSWKGPFHKVAHRDMENLGRTLFVKVEREDEGCVVTVRLSTGDANKDPVQAAEFLDRIGESVVLTGAPAPTVSPAPAPTAAPAPHG
jgi:hypothetical protein